MEGTFSPPILSVQHYCSLLFFFFFFLVSFFSLCKLVVRVRRCPAAERLASQVALTYAEHPTPAGEGRSSYRTGVTHQMMVTVQHRPPGIAFWQPSHHNLLPYQAACPPVVPCQWHHTATSQSVSVPPAPYVPALLAPQPPPAATVEPEQPIGYGSFGVVW